MRHPPSAGEASGIGPLPKLNLVDRVMAPLHEALRRRGYGGLLLHSYLFLRGRVDEARLRGALERLRQCYPVVTARLVPGRASRPPRWEALANADSLLTVVTLDTPDLSAVWRYGERLFGIPIDCRGTAALQLHLLHLGGGRDALVVQWAHGLMDGMGGELLLREVNRLADGAECAGEDTGPRPPGKLLLEHAYGQTFRRRWQSIFALLRNLWPGGKSLQLMAPGWPASRPSPTRIGMRSLDEAQTRLWLERVRRLCGFVSPAPVLLASAFRAVARLAPAAAGPRRVLNTAVPLNLRAPGATRPIFANLQTYVCLRARKAALADRDSLVRVIQRQFRDWLRREVDRAFLLGVGFLSLHPGLVPMGLNLLSRNLSFIFGYHGALAPGLETFCGAPVEHLYTGLPIAWAPPGLSFAAHQFNGRLNLMVSTAAEAVPEKRAEAFLDALVEDLLP
jgi:hypothetical protein